MELRAEARLFVQTDSSALLDLSLALISELGKLNVESIVISGAPFEVLDIYRQKLRLSFVYGLQLATTNGIYNGNVSSNPGISTEKRKIVSKVLADVDILVAIGMGNSHSDMPLFDVAPLSVVVGDMSLNVQGRSIQLLSQHDISEILEFIKKGG